MFIENKFYRFYISLTKRCKSENRVLRKRVNPEFVYYEKHHIIPRSMGGDDLDSNIVLLTPREHFVCHRLLLKFTYGDNKRKMAFALMRMSKGTNGNLCASRMYDGIRREISNAISGAHHPNYGRPGPNIGKKFTDEHRRKISASQKGKVITEQAKNRQSLAMKGRTCTEEHKRKVSDAVSGIGNGMYGKTHSASARNAIRDANSREWIITQPCGNTCVIKNLSEFCRENSLDLRAMQRVSTGARPRHKGFSCRRA